MNDVDLEHRLTVIEEKLDDIGTDTKTLIEAVKLQNGRVRKLETWRAQFQVFQALILVLSPFIFYGLTRFFGH